MTLGDGTKTVLVLGAGASKAYEDSPTGCQMPISRDLFRTYEKLPISENPWVLVGNIINYGRDVLGIDILEFFRTGIDIEEFHSGVEDTFLRSLGQDDAVRHLSWGAYTQLIYLFSSVINEIQNGPPSRPHLELARSLSQDDVIITFNWDTLMDRALHEVHGWCPDDGYGVKACGVFRDGWDKPLTSADSSRPLILKLHGSTNWITSAPIVDPHSNSIVLTQSSTPETFYVYEYATKPYATYAGRYMAGYVPYSYGYYPPNILDDPGKEAGEGEVFIRARPRFPWIPEGEAESKGLVTVPLVIPPVRDKSYGLYGKLLEELWHRAEEAIREADRIVLIGYSFPHTDHRSNALFTNALMRRDRIPSIAILDPSPDRVYVKFTHDLGVPASEIRVFKEYFSVDFSLDRLN